VEVLTATKPVMATKMDTGREGAREEGIRRGRVRGDSIVIDGDSEQSDSNERKDGTVRVARDIEEGREAR